MPGMLICSRSLSTEQHLGEKAPAKEKGPLQSRDPMVRARRNPYYPARTENARRKSRQDDGRCRLCEKSLGCTRYSTRPPPRHRQASKVRSSPPRLKEGAGETRASSAQTRRSLIQVSWRACREARAQAIKSRGEMLAAS